MCENLIGSLWDLCHLASLVFVPVVVRRIYYITHASIFNPDGLLGQNCVKVCFCSLDYEIDLFVNRSGQLFSREDTLYCGNIYLRPNRTGERAFDIYGR